MLPGAPGWGLGEAHETVQIYRKQIAYALRLAESGTPLADVCRQLGVSEATYYTWKKKYAEFGVSELRKLKQLEDENNRLRRLVADLTLDKQILQEVVRKKL
ncbi:putative transposase [Cupriavidus plantarum]|nr:putative transposase [Cupriavidus plantarum]